MVDENSIFVAFDTETTGLSAAQGRIVEIAALKFDMAGGVIGEMSQLVNPQAPIPADAMAVHGITDEMVASMPLISEVLPRFLEFAAADNAILIAQNALFDIGFVNHEALRHDIKLSRNTILDQIDFTRQTFPDLPSYALEPTCRTFGLVETQEHRAMADSVLVMRLFLYCLRRYPAIDDALAVLNSLYHYTFGGPMTVKISEELMAVITLALETGATLEIVYAGGSRKGLPRRIVPTLLFNRDGVMFLTARCLLSNTNKHFRLDRIKECRIVADDIF
jgi:DNA polymerase-3 subunit epsilon